MKIISIEEKYNNKKLIDVLLSYFPGLSSSTIDKALRKKDIRINDKRISENCVLKLGDEVKIFIADNLLEKKIDIPVIYEDENIVAFNKPTNLETTGDNSLTSCVKQLYNAKNTPYIEPCHRLDRNTSGIILFAKNPESEQALLEAFKNHTIEKHYVCVTYGIPHSKSKKLQAYLFKDSKKALVYISDVQKQGYQKILTSYSLVKKNENKNLSLLDVTLETGRTHQIRAHLAHIGLPILGDGKYGNNQINKSYGQKIQCLSSYSIKFHFKEGSILYYLNDKTIKQHEIPFTNLI